MRPEPKAKIFLSEERGCQEADWFRSYSTFIFGKYCNEHKQAFNDLYVLNDDTIAGGNSMNFEVEENTYVLLLPIAGSVVTRVNEHHKPITSAGELQVFYLRKGSSIEFSNYYKHELINFIQLWIKTEDVLVQPEQLYEFDLDSNKNKLTKIMASTGSKIKSHEISIGMFDGRSEAVYELQNKENNLFVFVIEGVFEVQGRLLHARDGLGLWQGHHTVEMEALCNNAIILLLESVIS